MGAQHAEPPDLATFLGDPFAVLASGRREGWYWPSDAGLPGMTVLRYEDVRTILRDDRFHADFTEMLRSFGEKATPCRSRRSPGTDPGLWRTRRRS